MPPRLRGRIVKVTLLSLLIGAFLALSLSPVTYRLAGAAGLLAMGVALLISLVSNVVGTLPACWQLGLPGAVVPPTVLQGMIIRMVALVLLAVPAVLSGLFPPAPLLLWLSLGYFAMLMSETVLIVHWMNHHHRVKT